MLAITLAWLQSSTREIQCHEYLKLVFLEIPNVRFGTVFQNPATYYVCVCVCACMYMYVYLNPTTTRLSLLLHDSDVEPRLSINNITYKCSGIILSVDFG